MKSINIIFREIKKLQCALLNQIPSIRGGFIKE